MAGAARGESAVSARRRRRSITKTSLVLGSKCPFEIASMAYGARPRKEDFRWGLEIAY
jgi:hypothetical protein